MENVTENFEHKLGEICEFKRGKQLSKSSFVDGEYPVIGGGKQPVGYHNEYNFKENTNLCSSSGANAGYISRYSNKVWASDCFGVVSINENVMDSYVYYYLSSKQDDIYKKQTGMAQPHVYPKDMEDFLVMVPPLKRQEKIVNYLDLIYEQQIPTIEKKINQLEEMKRQMLICC